MAAYSGCGERDGGIGHGKRRSRTGLARVGGDVGALADGRRQAGSGMARSRARARLNLLLPRPVLWKMQGQAACRAGDPPGQGEDPSSEGLGGHDPFTQADAGCPAGQVVGHRLDGQPGAVGGEAPRGEMVQPDAVLEVPYRILDLGVAAVISLQFEGLPVPVGDEAVIAVGGKEGELGTGRRLHPSDDEPYRRGVRLGLEGGVEPVSEVFSRTNVVIKTASNYGRLLVGNTILSSLASIIRISLWSWTSETSSVGGLGHIGGAVHPVRNRRPGIFGYRLDEIVQAFVLADGDGEANIHFPVGGDESVGV